MSDLRDAARQALEALEGGVDSWRLIGPAIDALKAALTEEALQRLTDVHQEIESMIVDEGCFERGCACHDSRESPGVVVVKQPEQEPVAWANMKGDGTFALLSISQHQEDRANWMHPVPLYTHPPRREWRGLNRDETMHLMNDTAENYWADEAHIQRFARAIEAALRSKNHA